MSTDIQSRMHVERSDGAFEDWLPLSAKRTAPGEYDIVNCEGRVLWRMEGRSLAEWVCELVNASPVVAAAVAWAEADDDYLRYATDTTSERYDEALGALKTAVEKLNDAAPPRDAGEGE
jgi:hypothetical protein